MFPSTTTSPSAALNDTIDPFELHDLGRRIVAGVAEMSSFMAGWLAMLAEFDRREGWAAEGAKSCSHWLSWKCGLDGATARAHVRVAAQLVDLRQVRTAFGEGRLSYSKPLFLQGAGHLPGSFLGGGPLWRAHASVSTETNADDVAWGRPRLADRGPRDALDARTGRGGSLGGKSGPAGPLPSAGADAGECFDVTPIRHARNVDVPQLPITPWFSSASHELSQACQRLGLVAPSFRSPPADPDVDRTLRWHTDGGAVVAVRLWGRAFTDIRADMVDGVLAANRLRLPSVRAIELRARLEDVVPVPEGRKAA